MYKDLIDNEKLNEAVSLIQEMYHHMYLRIGMPDVEDPDWDVEGAAHLHFTLQVPSYKEFSTEHLKPAEAVAVIMNTKLLARRDPHRQFQNFQTVEQFYQQVKNWHAYEMSLSLEDKNADYYFDPHK